MSSTAFLRRLRTPYEPLPAHRFEAAATANRPLVLAEALLLLMVGLSLDDLQVLVAAGWLVGAAAAIAWHAGGPLVRGRILARRLSGRGDGGFEEALRRRIRAGRLILLVTSLLGIAWLVYFAEGVPPWAR